MSAAHLFLVMATRQQNRFTPTAPAVRPSKSHSERRAHDPGALIRSRVRVRSA